MPSRGMKSETVTVYVPVKGRTMLPVLLLPLLLAMRAPEGLNSSAKALRLPDVFTAVITTASPVLALKA